MRTFFLLIHSTLLCSLLLAFSVTGFAQDNPRNTKKGGKKVKKSWQDATQKLINDMPKEQRERLKNLQKDNPVAFRKEIQTIAKKHRSKQLKQALKKEMEALVNKYHQAKGNEKEKILSEIREKVSKQFHDKMANNRANIEKTGKRLDELKELQKTREDNAEKIIKERIEYLTKDPSLRW